MAAALAGALVAASGTARAGKAGCPHGAGGYAYAGHQAAQRGHGVRSTISLLRAPEVEAGHVAGWVGVGGPGQGANGGDAWIQAGIAAVPGVQPFLYAEVTREGRAPDFILLEEEVPVGRGYRIAVLEVAGRPGYWRVWVDGEPRTEPVHLAGSSGRWAPIATAESWDGGRAACNAFGFRFERTSVAYGRGGSWRPFVPGYRFLQPGYELRDLASAPAERGVYRRAPQGAGPLPYAFRASS